MFHRKFNSWCGFTFWLKRKQLQNKNNKIVRVHCFTRSAGEIESFRVLKLEIVKCVRGVRWEPNLILSSGTFDTQCEEWNVRRNENSKSQQSREWEKIEVSHLARLPPDVNPKVTVLFGSPVFGWPVGFAKVGRRREREEHSQLTACVRVDCILSLLFMRAQSVKERDLKFHSSHISIFKCSPPGPLATDWVYLSDWVRLKLCLWLRWHSPHPPHSLLLHMSWVTRVKCQKTMRIGPNIKERGRGDAGCSDERDGWIERWAHQEKEEERERWRGGEDLVLFYALC